MFDPVELARATVSSHVTTGAAPKAPVDVPEEWRRRAGVFVSIKKAGELRGCIGTFMPVQSCVVEEIMVNAVSSAIRDPRFTPLTADELESLEFSVDVLEPMEQVFDVEELDPKVYGVLVRAKGRSGLLLPDLEGVDSVEQQLAIAMQKGGIGQSDDAELWRFRVKRYGR